MFGKILLIIITFGLTSAQLLVLRHERLNEAHRISMLHQRILERETELWRIRGDVARMSHPAAVRDLLREHPDRHWIPLPPIELPGPTDREPH